MMNSRRQQNRTQPYSQTSSYRLGVESDKDSQEEEKKEEKEQERDCKEQRSRKMHRGGSSRSKVSENKEVALVVPVAGRKNIRQKNKTGPVDLSKIEKDKRENSCLI